MAIVVILGYSSISKMQLAKCNWQNAIGKVLLAKCNWQSAIVMLYFNAEMEI